MNEQIEKIYGEACILYGNLSEREFLEKFAQLIVKEMCDMMEQAEDDSYHCFEPSERPMDYIRFLYDWRTRFEKHFGVEE